MDTQEVRIDQLEEIMQVTFKAQTDTLRVLKNIESRVEENSARLDEHSKRFESLENLMILVLEELVAIKGILASSRGIGFAPEPDDGD